MNPTIRTFTNLTVEGIASEPRSGKARRLHPAGSELLADAPSTVRTIACSRCGQAVEIPVIPRALRKLKVGDRVRVPKGASVRRYGPDWPIREEPAKRSMTVRVSGIHGPYDHAPYETPRVEWLGRGGYGRTALLSDLVAA